MNSYGMIQTGIETVTAMQFDIGIGFFWWSLSLWSVVKGDCGQVQNLGAMSVELCHTCKDCGHNEFTLIFLNWNHLFGPAYWACVQCSLIQPPYGPEFGVIE